MKKYSDLTDLVQNMQIEIKKAYNRGYEQCRKDLIQKILSQMNENENATLELGKTYNFVGYEWTVAELHYKYAVLQSHGVTHGDFCNYDKKIQMLYSTIKNVDYTNEGLYLISKDEYKGFYRDAIQIATKNYKSFGASSSIAWLGTPYNKDDGWVIYSDGSFGNYDMSVDCVIAPAFNLDISKIKVVGDEIIIKE